MARTLHVILLVMLSVMGFFVFQYFILLQMTEMQRECVQLREEERRETGRESSRHNAALLHRLGALNRTLQRNGAALQQLRAVGRSNEESEELLRNVRQASEEVRQVLDAGRHAHHSLRQGLHATDRFMAVANKAAEVAQCVEKKRALREEEERRGVRIALCIPCMWEVFLRCRDALLYSIALQTVAPDEVFIAVAGVPEGGALAMRQWLDSLVSAWPVAKRVHLLPRKQVWNQSNQRNYLIRHTTADVISLFDCDDVPHMRRMEIVKRVFEERPLSGLMLHAFQHSYVEKRDPVRWITQELRYPSGLVYNGSGPVWSAFSPQEVQRKFRTAFDGSPNWFNLCCLKPMFDRTVEISNGWTTFRRWIWEQHTKFDETFSTGDVHKVQLGEDSRFNSLLILGGFNATIVPWKLGLYNRPHPRQWGFKLPSEEKDLYGLEASE